MGFNTIPDFERAVGALADALCAVKPSASGSTFETRAWQPIACAGAAHAVHLVDSAVGLAQRGDEPALRIVARNHVETVILAHWVILKKEPSVRRLLGAYERGTERMLNTGHFNFDRLKATIGDQIGLLTPERLDINLREVASEVGLLSLYDTVYRGESTFAAHGLGSFLLHLGRDEQIMISPPPDLERMLRDLYLMVRNAVALIDWLRVSFGAEPSEPLLWIVNECKSHDAAVESEALDLGVLTTPAEDGHKPDR
jgi:hypothetical protein